MGAFRLTTEPIEPFRLESELENTVTGALVTFAGRVRNRNEGRDVLHLFYEGANEIASTEFEHIETEARSRFEIEDIRCAHRIGKLELGEIAVWIGVSARHRGAAFDGCRYLIDELKQRLPIWKKEHYADGDSGWINHS